MKKPIGVLVGCLLAALMLGSLLLTAGCETTFVETKREMTNQRSSQHLPGTQTGDNGERVVPGIPAAPTSLEP